MEDRNWQEILRQQSEYINILERRLQSAEYWQEFYEREAKKHEQEVKRLRGDQDDTVRD